MSTAYSVLIGGSIAIDHIKTPVAEGKNLLGGSASFTGIAASYFASAVHLIGIIGKDFPQEHLDPRTRALGGRYLFKVRRIP
jgi:hypothetical protein